MAGLAVWSRTKPAAFPAGVLWRAMPQDAASAAQQLFAVLREFDDQGVNQIWIEIPPGGSDWDGVRDRLQRAAH
jgi:L-threonylcarbamoyladenylate synthase